MGEVTTPGQTMVARGGRGGLGVVRPSQWQQARGKFVEQVRLHCNGPHCLGILPGHKLSGRSVMPFCRRPPAP